MKRRLLPLGLAGVLLACGGSDTTTAEPVAATDAPAVNEADDAPLPTAAPTDPAAAAEAADGGVVAEAPTALQFSAPLLGGGDIEMASLAGRPVLLWFWAPW